MITANQSVLKNAFKQDRNFLIFTDKGSKNAKCIYYPVQSTKGINNLHVMLNRRLILTALLSLNC